MKSKFALFILFAMVAGVAAGWASNEYLSPENLKTATMIYGLLTKIFITLIKMIIAPLVLFTLIAGIGHMEDAASVGRVGLKSLGWFLVMSLVSLGIGIVMVEWLKPGVGMNLQVVGEAIKVPSTEGFTLEKFVEHLIPSSIIKAMADNEILQIVVFAVFVGTAISMLEKKSPRVMELAEEASAIMLKVTEVVMKFAPFAIFGALAKTVSEQGLPILVTYAKFMAGFYGAMGVLWALLIVLGFLFLGGRMLRVLGVIREPTLLAFSTASSEAAYPKLLAGLPTVGISRKIVSFVLPLGYSFNLDGSMIYCTFATLFIAQAYGVVFTTAQIIMMLFLLLITSKGIAGVPRASLVVIMATLAYFGLPAEWIALVLGVDHLLDMGRSATNVLGNSVASAVIAKWEGQLDVEEPAKV
ncbi:Proton/glutamate-aspartate symporter [Asticcacaulis sp. MM231]|uniref:dicarboxylate/amino acid:cation symporter n=1 Tax=Asticcacaulis sp. MM231 TaxID=3157666 RepID=UPI0032D5B015